MVHVQPATRKEQYSDAPLVVTPVSMYSSATASVRSSYGKYTNLYVRKHAMATRKKKIRVLARRINKKRRRDLNTIQKAMIVLSA